MTSKPFTLFGIRHHGPGSAGNLMDALQTLGPDYILIEGPPDANGIIHYAFDKAMKPPVALLVYAKDNAQDAVFYPFAEFSPEWQALRFASANNIPVQFMDLPQAMQIGSARDEKKNTEAAQTEDMAAGLDDRSFDGDKKAVISDAPDPGDPLDWFARHAGYEDGEAWWEQAVEERQNSTELFRAIADAMYILREQFPESSCRMEQLREKRREAYMRRIIRSVVKEGFSNIAVVCGAWHVPALDDDVKIKDDNLLLQRIAKIPIEATWVPWTYERLSRKSGYGAGVNSPGWYHHLWSCRQSNAEGDIAKLTIQWLIHVAGLLRKADLDASSAHIIEAVRLAESLAAMRERPFPGLEELNEAIQSVLCFGEKAPLVYIREQLLIGNRMGAIPPDTPKVPLQADLEKQQRSMKLNPSVATVEMDLDLRTPSGLARSHLLHRLNLLDIPWGRLGEADSRKRGTFHEFWTLQWAPEFSVRIIEASLWGSTVVTASSARAIMRASKADSISECAALVNAVILAELPEATEPVVSILRARSAETNDVTCLMTALPSLVTILRYGNVRKSDSSMVAGVVEGFIARICIGLKPACSSLDDDAASDMVEKITMAHQAVIMAEEDNHTKDWIEALHSIVDTEPIHALVRGKITRLLFNNNHMDGHNVAQRMSLAVSPGNEPAAAAAWIEGFLAGSGMLLMHDRNLWDILDAWVSSLSAERFMQILPLIRRTFSTFPSPERQQLGRLAKAGQRVLQDDFSVKSIEESPWNTEWGDHAVREVLALMGIS